MKYMQLNVSDIEKLSISDLKVAIHEIERLEKECPGKRNWKLHPMMYQEAIEELSKILEVRVLSLFTPKYKPEDMKHIPEDVRLTITLPEITVVSGEEPYDPDLLGHFNSLQYRHREKYGFDPKLLFITAKDFQYLTRSEEMKDIMKYTMAGFIEPKALESVLCSIFRADQCFVIKEERKKYNMIFESEEHMHRFHKARNPHYGQYNIGDRE